MSKAFYAVKARDGVYAIYGVEGASNYLGVTTERPAGTRDLRSADPRKAAAMRMDAGKRDGASKRYGGTDEERGDGGARSTVLAKAERFFGGAR